MGNNTVINRCDSISCMCVCASVCVHVCVCVYVYVCVCACVHVVCLFICLCMSLFCADVKNCVCHIFSFNLLSHSILVRYL